jgi:hypothetical protein
MTRRFFVGRRLVGLATCALIVASCATPQDRISDHPDLYQTLSPRDQALVSQGQIRTGMSRTAVWLAWGSPDRKIVGSMGAGRRETWVYVSYATDPCYPCYGPWDPIFGAPLYHPFYDSELPPDVPYPGKVVIFAKGRVVAFHYVGSH